MLIEDPRYNCIVNHLKLRSIIIDAREQLLFDLLAVKLTPLLHHFLTYAQFLTDLRHFILRIFSNCLHITTEFLLSW